MAKGEGGSASVRVALRGGSVSLRLGESLLQVPIVDALWRPAVPQIVKTTTSDGKTVSALREPRIVHRVRPINVGIHELNAGVREARVNRTRAGVQPQAEGS